MTITYKLSNAPGETKTGCIIRLIDNVFDVSIPLDEENRSYQEYLEWAKTNTAEAAD